MNFILSAFAEEQGYQVESYDCVDSTNHIALTKGLQENKDKLWVVANQQTAGRARRGRSWVSPKGNLYASLLLTSNFRLETAAMLGFVAGVSLAEALNDLLTANDISHDLVRLKWPNDVMLNGAKASGILLELKQKSDKNFALVVGIGLNVAHRYEDAPYPTQSLKNLGIDISCEKIFEQLSQSWAVNYHIFNSQAGRRMIKEKWLKLAAYLGQNITVNLEKQSVSGIFSGLDDEFNCIITDEKNNQIRVTAGDVHFGKVASSKAGLY